MDEYYKDLILPDWSEYFSKELDYYSNIDRQDLISRFKLKQIYQNFCIGRANYIFAHPKTNYGRMIIEGENNEWLRKMLLQNALIYYNTCIDFSWELIAFYYFPKNELEFNIKEEERNKIESEINKDELITRLNMKEDILTGKEKELVKKIKKLVLEYMEEPLTKRLRKDYNDLKHNRTMDILDLYKNSFEQFESKCKELNVGPLKLIDFNIDYYEEKLKEFNNSLNDYIEKLLKLLIKPNYKESKYSLGEIANNIANNMKID